METMSADTDISPDRTTSTASTTSTSAGTRASQQVVSDEEQKKRPKRMKLSEHKVCMALRDTYWACLDKRGAMKYPDHLPSTWAKPPCYEESLVKDMDLCPKSYAKLIESC